MPELLVFTTRWVLVLGLVTVTVTPATTAPVGSTTVPVIAPVGACAQPTAAIKTIVNKNASKRRIQPPSNLCSNSLARIAISASWVASIHPTPRLQPKLSVAVRQITWASGQAAMEAQIRTVHPTCKTYGWGCPTDLGS